MGLKEQALEYTQQGWPVIPLYIPKGADVCNCRKGPECPSIGKHPVPNRGLSEATLIASQVELWWKRMPSANIGIRTGVDAGIFVLDVDIDEDAGKNGFATLADLEAKHGPLPLTRMAITGRGGRHYVFRHPGGDVRIKNSATTTLGNGLDVRGDGGYIVAPPSLHASGRNYAWENDIEPADAPQWLIDMVKKRDEEPAGNVRPGGSIVMISDERARKYGLSALESAAREFASVGKGGRNQELNRAAFKVAQLSASCGISEAMAEAVLLDAAAACGLLQDDGRDQCVKTFKSGWRQGLGKPREYTPIDREVPAPPRKPKPAAPPAEDFDEDLVADYESRGEELADEDGDQGGDGGQPPSGGAGSGGSDGRLPVDMTHLYDDHRRSHALLNALQATNSPPHIFQRGRDILRLILKMTGDNRDQRTVVPEELRPATLKAHVETKLRPLYYKKDEDIEKAFAVKKDLAEQMLCQEHWPFPYLRGVVHSPVFAPTGELATEEGYNEAACVYLDLDGFKVPDVPERPMAEDLERAKSLIFDDLLVDFPFKDQASRANACALLLLPFVRPLISDATPLHVVDATEQGTGKGLLVNMLSFIATGRAPMMMTAAKDEAEWDKRILATLRSSPTVISIDNVDKPLTAAPLAAALTTTEYTSRIMGLSEMVTVQNISIWAATGNNVMMSKDMARRSVWIRMNPQMDQPWLRQKFKHNPLQTWVKENRAELAWAALVVIRHWIASGRPSGPLKIGSYEDWSRVLSGILNTAGIEGFMENRIEMYESADRDSAEWRAFVELWHAEHGEQTVLASSLYTIATDNDLLARVMGDKNERSQRTKLSLALSKQVDRVFVGFRIAKGDADGHHKVGTFRLIPVDALKVEVQQENVPQRPARSPGLFDEGDA
jgi:hypothetical protein